MILYDKERIKKNKTAREEKKKGNGPERRKIEWIWKQRA